MIHSERYALKRELASLIRRLEPSTHQTITPLLGPLIDGIDEQHTHILLSDAQCSVLAEHPCPNLIGDPASNSPILLWENRLYFRRYYNLERRIANQLIARHKELNRSESDAPMQHVRRTYPLLSAQQIEAVELAHTRSLSVITGGPGTGKTTLIKALLSSVLASNADLRVALAAPTGKAVARLERSLDGLSSSPDQVEVKTLHRLLGYGAGRRPRYDSNQRLALDLIVIDEASMIDLNLADALLQALPDDAQLILIGDPNQLPSVNLGRLLADLAQPLQSGELLLQAAQCQLTENFRFEAKSGIDALAQAIVAQRPISLDQNPAVQWLEPEALDDQLLMQAFSAWLDCLGKPSAPTDFFEALDACRILAPQYGGPYGVMALNQRVISILQKLKLVEINPRDHFHGQPLLIMKNDYGLDLFNGDVGFCIDPKQCGSLTQDLPQSSTLIACFKHHRENTLRYFSISALPEHETCFAMTVHKAQGSEFDEVLFVLDEADSEPDHHLLTQELIYTGVTRAKERLKLITSQQTWIHAAHHRLQRRSGLKAMLSAMEAP